MQAGTVGHYEIMDSTGTVCHEQGTVTATGGGGDMTVVNTCSPPGSRSRSPRTARLRRVPSGYREDRTAGIGDPILGSIRCGVWRSLRLGGNAAMDRRRNGRDCWDHKTTNARRLASGQECMPCKWRHQDCVSPDQGWQKDSSGIEANRWLTN